MESETETNSSSYTSDSDIELDDDIVQTLAKSSGGKVQLPPTVFGQNTDWTDESGSDVTDISDGEDIPVVYEDGTQDVVFDEDFDFSDTESDAGHYASKPDPKKHEQELKKQEQERLAKEQKAKQRKEQEKKRKEQKEKDEKKAAKREEEERRRKEKQRKEQKEQKAREEKERQERAERERQERRVNESKPTPTAKQNQPARPPQRTPPSNNPNQPNVQEEDLNKPYEDPNDTMEEDSNLHLTMMPIKINPQAVLRSQTRDPTPNNQAEYSPSKGDINVDQFNQPQGFGEPFAQPPQQSPQFNQTSPSKNFPQLSSKPISPASSPGRVSQLTDVDPERQFPVPFQPGQFPNAAGLMASPTGPNGLGNSGNGFDTSSRRSSIRSSSTSSKPISNTSSRHSSISSKSSRDDKPSDSKSSSKHSSRNSSRHSSISSSTSSKTSVSSSSHHSRSSRTSKDDKKRENRKREKERENKFRKAVFDEEMKEKKELIYALYVMEQDGHPVSKRYTMDDDIFEMRFEYNKLKNEDDLKTKVQSAWDWFHTGNHLVEYLNERLNPFDISMDGWSDLLDADKQKYEPHFRKLYKQFACKFQVKPAVQIAMLFGGQLAMFVLPKFMDKIKTKKNDPKNLADATETAYAWGNNDTKAQTAQTQKPQTQNVSDSERELKKEIKEMNKRINGLLLQIDRQNQIIEQTQRMLLSQNQTRSPQYYSDKVEIPTPANTVASNPSPVAQTTVNTPVDRVNTTGNISLNASPVKSNVNQSKVNFVPETNSDSHSINSESLELESESDDEDGEIDFDVGSEMTGPVNNGPSLAGILGMIMKKSPSKQEKKQLPFQSVYDAPPEKPEYLNEVQTEEVQNTEEIENDVSEERPKGRSMSSISRKSTTLLL
jgi:hypothetical protein